MSEAFARFTEFFSDFRKTPEWRAMVNTCENSPWHREANVGVHTQMLLDWYKENLFMNRSEKQRMLTLVAGLFHDIGKPSSEIVKFSKDRGNYRTYSGHEQVSARMWVDYAMSNKDVISGILRLSIDDVANIALMLEYHLPFGLKDKNKQIALKQAIMTRMGSHGHQAYLDLLMSDQHGRVSDNQVEKLATVDNWIKEWQQL
jgi:hypothetical protein